MTITVELTDDEMKRLEKRANDSGVRAPVYVSTLIRKDLRAARTISEALAPIQEGFANSGLDEEELESLMYEAREEVWRERRPKRTAQ